MFTIKSVSYYNFMAIGHATVDFSVKGLTAVEGANTGRPGKMDSNAAGKSALLDGIAFVFYGRCIRPDCAGDAVVKKGSTGGCCVEALVTGEGREITVRRFRKSVKHGNTVQLQVKDDSGTVDMTCGTSAETDKRIEAVLGMDFAAFLNSAAFCAREDIKSFFSSPDAERKAVLERLLDLELLTLAEKVARERQAGVHSSMVEVDHNISIAQSSINAAEGTTARLALTVDNLKKSSADVYMQRVSEAADKFERLSRDVQQQERSVQRLRETAKYKREALDARVATITAEFDAKASEYRVAVESAMAGVAKLDNAAAGLEGSLRPARKSLESLSALSGTCPTCKQPVSAATLRQHTDELQAKITDLEAQKAQAVAAMGKAQAELDKLRKTAPVRLPAPPTEDAQAAERVFRENDNVLSRLRGEAASAGVAVQKYQQDLETFRENVKVAEKQLQQERDSLDKLRGELVSLTRAKEGFEDKAADLQFWVTGFGNKGLKSLIMENALPEIGQRATLYARRLLGDGAVVSLQATSKLKSDAGAVREKLSVNCCFPGYADSYAVASRGTKQRLDLSVLLAIRDMAVARNPRCFDAVFIDELLDGLDRTGTEVVTEMLREMADTRPVFMVTHNPDLRGVASRVLTVVHDGKEAKVVEG